MSFRCTPKPYIYIFGPAKRACILSYDGANLILKKLQFLKLCSSSLLLNPIWRLLGPTRNLWFVLALFSRWTGGALKSKTVFGCPSLTTSVSTFSNGSLCDGLLVTDVRHRSPINLSDMWKGPREEVQKGRIRHQTSLREVIHHTVNVSTHTQRTCVQTCGYHCTKADTHRQVCKVFTQQVWQTQLRFIILEMEDALWESVISVLTPQLAAVHLQTWSIFSLCLSLSLSRVFVLSAQSPLFLTVWSLG